MARIWLRFLPEMLTCHFYAVVGLLPKIVCKKLTQWPNLSNVP